MLLSLFSELNACHDMLAATDVFSPLVAEFDGNSNDDRLTVRRNTLEHNSRYLCLMLLSEPALDC